MKITPFLPLNLIFTSLRTAVGLRAHVWRLELAHVCSQEDKESWFGVKFIMGPLYTCMANFHFSARGVRYDFTVKCRLKYSHCPVYLGLSALLCINWQLSPIYHFKFCLCVQTVIRQFAFCKL